MQEENLAHREGRLYHEVYGEVLDTRLQLDKRLDGRLEKRLDLPNIIIDHSNEDCSQYDSLRGMERSDGREGQEKVKVNLTDIPDIVSHVKQIPVIIINHEAASSDEEMEDYYDNHKDWPAGVR